MLKKLKVSHKITLMICAVALPLVGWTIFATLTGVSKDIQFARQEQKGNQYQRPLQGLLDTLPQHQWLVDAATRGDTAARATLGEKEIEIEQHLSDLDNAQTKYGKDLQFTDAGLAKRKRTGADPAGLRSQWQKLKGATLAPADNAAAHQALIATVRTMISHAGDTSNLILDPDLDSYYLMDATLLTLPQMQDRLARLVSELRVNESARADSVTQNSLTRTTQLTTLVAADLDHLQHAVETSLNEDADNNGTSATLQDNLPAPAAACQSAGQEFLKLVSELRVNEPASAASLIDSKLTDSLTNFRATTSALWQVASSELNTLLAKRAAAKSQTRLITLGGVSVTLVIFVVAALFVSRSITHPLAGLTQATQRILRGENTVRAPVYSRDEIGALASTFNNMLDARNRAQAALESENKRLQTNIQDLLVVVSDASDGKLSVRAKVSEGALGNVCDALNLMLENVGGIIANAKSASDQVAAASNGITTVAAELEKGEQRQTAEILTTSEGVRDLNGKAQKVLANCQAATQAAANGRQAAEQGAKAVREVIQGMEKIRENTQANAKKIKRLGDRSMEISGIVKIIGDISAKTDMLALNASIEAARAGEQGRGFTIVAEQVRGLADRTKTLTNQIEKLVNDIQKETGEAVAQMETQTQEVEAGARAAQSAGGTLENIVTVSSESAELVSQINQSATQQAVRTQEMLTTVETINQVVAESAAKVRETRSTSEQLLALSAELNKRLAQFEITSGPDSVVYEPGVMVE